MSSLGAKGLFGSTNILQVADVNLWVVFFLFLLFLFNSLPNSSWWNELSEMITIFVLSTKTTQPRPQVFLINVQ